jgi:signal transduction histidine kinase
MMLQDINGKLIIKGLIETASNNPAKKYGWYHYEWKTPDGLLPRWKSSFVKLVTAPSGKSYIVGSGKYNDRMERSFVVDEVNAAVAAIEKNPEEAFKMFHDPKGQFLVKDAYIFVIEPSGIELVNPPTPILEGRNVMDIKDTKGKMFVREMFRLLETKNAGWVDYMWPKPGESVSTQKTTYVTKANMGGKTVLVGCGVYLADAPKAAVSMKKMSAPELMTLVREAATLLEEKGEAAYPELRKEGTKWHGDDTYFFVWSFDGIRMFNAAHRETEGVNIQEMKDVLGRPMGRLLLDAAATASGEGWVHYMWPEPGDIFPTWKSSFVKRVTFPSGKQYLVGCGIYNMQMDKAFIEDVVNRASTLIQQKGKEAFPLLRDKKGEFWFMDTYIFVDDGEGTEVVNAAQPILEGMNLMNLKDAHGNYAARDYIQTALKNGSGWVDYYWYKPGNNEPAHKYTYVKKVEFGKEVYIVGAGLYLDEKK